jgi:hypothetical protein
VTTGRIDDFNRQPEDVAPMPPDPEQNAVPDSTFQWDNAPKASVIGDAASLVFAFTPPVSQNMSFRYIFASTELPWFMGAQYDDVLQMLVNGVNVALLPNGMQVGRSVGLPIDRAARSFPRIGVGVGALSSARRR